MSRQSKSYRLGDDEAILETHAAIMAHNQGIEFDEAKEAMVEEYHRNLRNAETSKGIDEEKFKEGMDKFIERTRR